MSHDPAAYGYYTNYNTQYHTIYHMDHTTLSDELDESSNQSREPILDNPSKEDTASSLLDLYDQSHEIQYGIPRLHHYPLDSRKNCIRAIHGIRGCNNIHDCHILIENLMNVNEAEGYNLSIPKYQDIVNEANHTPWIKLSKRERQQEKIRLAKEYLNTQYYFPNKIDDILERYPFMEYFYPNFGRMDFHVRVKYMCGGAYIYDEYDPTRNWFEVSLAKDEGHIKYCDTLYKILDRVLDQLYINESDYPYLMDWRQRVCYHYDRLQEEDIGSKEYLIEAQYLFDLCWSILDDPYIDENIENARRWFFCTIVQSGDVSLAMNERVVNTDMELYHDDPVEEYLVDTLPLSGEDYLLPATMEYPIVNQNSIKLAMDIIDSIPEEQREEYARNLNRKYEEFRCRFKISSDHPFAPYAGKLARGNIILPLILYDVALRESDTVVDDQGTSDAGSTEPWIRRIDQRGGADSDHEFYPDTELGPNDYNDDQDDFTRHYSIL